MHPRSHASPLQGLDSLPVEEARRTAAELLRTVDPLVLAVVFVGLVLFVFFAMRRRVAGEASESRRAHERAQDREPPVEIGETYEFGVREFTDHHSGTRTAVGKVEGFVLFVEDVPDSLSEGDVIRAKVLSFNQGRTSADATLEDVR